MCGPKQAGGEYQGSNRRSKGSEAGGESTLRGIKITGTEGKREVIFSHKFPPAVFHPIGKSLWENIQQNSFALLLLKLAASRGYFELCVLIK